MKRLLLALVLSLCSLRLPAEESLSAREASKHVGERATVCGLVASTHFATRSKGQPTFLNLDEPYPKAVFTVLIRGGGPAQVWGTRSSVPRQADLRHGRDQALSGRR